MKHIMIMLSMCFAMIMGYHQVTPTINTPNHATREITVQAGDTLWDIAARSTHADTDVRETVYTLKELNQISDSGSLVPGSKIKVPVHKEGSPVRAMDYMAQN